MNLSLNKFILSYIILLYYNTKKKIDFISIHNVRKKIHDSLFLTSQLNITAMKNQEDISFKI